jgi:excisionase family DNA binding protein
MDDQYLSTWKTKQEAADTLRVSTKTIERLANAGSIRKAERRAVGGRAVPVFNPIDISALNVGSANPSDEDEITPRLPRSVERALRTRGKLRPEEKLAVLSALVGNEFVPLKDRLWLSIEETARYSGLSRGMIRRLLDSGRLNCIKDGQISKIWRRDLEHRHLPGEGKPMRETSAEVDMSPTVYDQ